MVTILAATRGSPAWEMMLLQENLTTVSKYGKATQQGKSKLELLLGYGKTSYKNQHAVCTEAIKHGSHDYHLQKVVMNAEAQDTAEH
jgi:hypothetical protein